MISIDNQIEEIEILMKANQYSAAILKCSNVFEHVLKKVYGQALVTLPFNLRNEMNVAENEIGKNVKGYTEFGFGQLVALFNRCDLLTKWAKTTNKELGLIKSISLNPIVDLRNKIAHDSAEKITSSDAQLVYVCLKNWLAFIGYASIEDNVINAFQTQPKVIEEKNDVSKRYEKHIKTRQVESTYTFSKKSEQVRLGKAVDIYKSIDIRSINYVLENIDKKEHLNVIDIGCANGKVTESRFFDTNIYDNVVGVDYNKDIIEEKIKNGVDNLYHYYCVDLESDEFEGEIEKIEEELNIEKFDIIFSSLVIHHLKRPEKILRILSKHIKKGGAIILRGAEDGCKVAYDDDGLVNEIIQKSVEVKGMSDRFHGRKFYTQLYRSGFRKIQMVYEERDTVGKDFDERLEMYQLSFAYRRDYFERQLKMDPDNVTYQEAYSWICNALDELEEMFVMPDFYYFEVVPVAIGLK